MLDFLSNDQNYTVSQNIFSKCQIVISKED